MIIPNVLAIAAVDPGRTTGVARGIFRPGKEATLASTLATATQLESWECTGSLAEQAEEIVGELDDWLSWAHIESGVAMPDLHLVVESFALRTAHADLTPVKLSERIDERWPYVDSAPWIEIERQTPAHAKGYATDERLRRWGVWVKGSTHRRDAMRHVCLRLNRALG